MSAVSGPEAAALRAEAAVRRMPAIGLVDRALRLLDAVIVTASALALVLASLVLSYSVLSRHFFQAATYWQDEFSVFLIVGATFMSAAHVQSRRGHVGIEALAELLPPAGNRVRLVVADALSLAFCAFFAWKSWTLFEEAWTDGQTSSSTWAPPLWVPYSLMAAGMTLLSVQIALQLAASLGGSPAVATSAAVQDGSPAAEPDAR